MRVRGLQAEATYTATFARPAYEFVSRWVDLFGAIHHRFSPLGARPEDTRLDSLTWQPQDFLVTWMNWRVGAVVRYRLGSFDVWTRDQRLLWGETPPVIGVISAAMAAAKDIAEDLSLLSQTAIFQGHGRLEEGTVSDIMRKLVPGTEWARPEAVRFQVAAGEGVEATIDVQRSLALPDVSNAWAALTLVFPGATNAQDVCVRTASFANEILERADVDLDWGS